jgi:hypothetical protein
MGNRGDIVVLIDLAVLLSPFCNWLRICAVELLLLSLCVEWLMSSMSSKCLPFNISFIFRNRKKSLEALALTSL